MNARVGDLAGRGPLGLKQPKSKRGAKSGKDHMARVAALPCVLCGYWPVEVHHCISGRYSQHKAPDTHTIPLCFNHHRGAEGIHTSKAAWEALNGPDTDFLPVVADMLAGELTPVWRP
jgi:hypothetical protein